MVSHIDHIVLTVRDIDRSVAFFTRVLGMEDVTFAQGRRALRFGSQKINLQTLGQETRNYAGIGSGDICLITNWTLDQVLSYLQREGIEVVEGPVGKSGATGPISSVYFNDPDGNLIEISTYD
ncbi:MAG: VOC family protein [Methyloligellaceae bacterium]